MTLFLEILFYLLTIIVLNSFIFYPLVVYFLSKKNSGRITIHGFEPTISVLIAAYNEEKVIEDRIKNIVALNYDHSKIEVFIGSDLSSDRTNEILLEYQKEYSWLKVYLSQERMGKAGILNELIKQANNEIVVFTDANTNFNQDALKNIIEDFADENVGGVCGRLILIDDEQSKSEGVEETEYWKYETLIKKAEGRCGTLLAANGGIFAIRKNLYEVIPTENAVTDDLFVSLSVVSKGYKFTYCNDAVAYENTGKDLSEEYKRKVRFGATNFQTLLQFKKLLWDKNKFLSYAFFSHKVSRWILPGLLIFLFFVSYFLIDINQIAKKIFYLQMVIYLLALCGYLLSIIKKRILIFSLPYFFVVSNIAIAEGFIKFIRKKHSVIWESTQR
ncbi:MAG: glycosyltransferase family 2 protein [Ignavibacteria bacterium]|nr:glycosyltransferase family 2 protein [Ignavibacteria bacterium]